MAKIINVGEHREHTESRGRALVEAGHHVQNAFSVTELEQHLRAEKAEMLVIGHSLPPQEKRRVLECVKHIGKRCTVVEVYVFVPELMTADEHVRWSHGPDALVQAVNRAACVAKE